jgi:hypothetical protein
VDSEGTEMGDATYHSKLLTLTCLLACNGGVLIHNEKHYANTAIQTQSLLATVMKQLKGLEHNQFPHLCFLVRDFDSVVAVDGVDATLDQFFTHLLKDNGDQADTARQVPPSPF